MTPQTTTTPEPCYQKADALCHDFLAEAGAVVNGLGTIFDELVKIEGKEPAHQRKRLEKVANRLWEYRDYLLHAAVSFQEGMGYNDTTNNDGK